jgi:hypothetical protein
MRDGGALRWLAAGVAVATAACSSNSSEPDEASLRALDAAYVEAWLTSDPDEQEKQVLSLFDPEAVIMPGGGLPPEAGLRNLKNFWFPEGAAPTVVTHFAHDIDGVEISGDMGFVSGRYTLSFVYENQTISQAGNYLIIADHGPSGWKIKRMIWNDQPLTEV